jgi:hypothetical protein
MKSLFLIYFIYSFTFVFSQTKKIHSGDSVWIALERKTIFKEIIPLRDSIFLFIEIIGLHVEESSILERDKLERAKEELIEFRTRLNLEIKDVSLTSQNRWTHEMIKKIRASVTATRHEYKRLRKKILIKGNDVAIQ